MINWNKTVRWLIEFNHYQCRVSAFTFRIKQNMLVKVYHEFVILQWRLQLKYPFQDTPRGLEGYTCFSNFLHEVHFVGMYFKVIMGEKDW